MERPSEASAVVEVERKRVVPEGSERLVVVTIHVPGEEVEDGHVHQVEESTTLVVGRDVTDEVTVVGL